MDFSDIVKKYRKIRGISQEGLARLLDITPSVICGYEAGRRNPKIEQRMQLAKVLDADPVEFAGIHLNKTDEIRLLMKLLNKYSSELFIDEKVDIDGEIIKKNVYARLSDDFEMFCEVYNICHEKIEELYTNSELSLIERSKAITEEYELIELFVDAYPEFDLSNTNMEMEEDKIEIDERKEELYQLLREDFIRIKRG